jgi:hypothetical protein
MTASRHQQTPTIVVLDPSTVERLAMRTADLIGQRLRLTAPSATEPDEAQRPLTAAEVAAHWSLHPNWVYKHARQLGAIQIGDGRRPRLRFDPDEVARRLNRAPTPPHTPASQSSSSHGDSP